MKTRNLSFLFILFFTTSIAYAQSNTDFNKSEIPVENKIEQADSVYFGCVPCCKPCSIYKTDKPGICPHCGMTLKKMIYEANLGQDKNIVKIDNPACKPPKRKRFRKLAKKVTD